MRKVIGPHEVGRLVRLCNLSIAIFRAAFVTLAFEIPAYVVDYTCDLRSPRKRS